MYLSHFEKVFAQMLAHKKTSATVTFPTLMHFSPTGLANGVDLRQGFSKSCEPDRLCSFEEQDSHPEWFFLLLADCLIRYHEPRGWRHEPHCPWRNSNVPPSAPREQSLSS